MLVAGRDPVAIDAWAARYRSLSDRPQLPASKRLSGCRRLAEPGGGDDQRAAAVSAIMNGVSSAARVTKRLEEIRLRAAHAGDWL